MDLRAQLQLELGTAYIIENELGGGGMSRVFVAEETALGRKIVIKVLPADTAGSVQLDRFTREIQVAARLQHPHIVPLLAAGEVDGLPFYTMPYVKGESLRARLARSGELAVNEAMHILRDVASALAHAHAEGVVHRDIKPDNILLSGGVAVVTDFGVAKAVDASAGSEEGGRSGLTSLGVALGTAAYMAPEQASADPNVDQRVDLYSFGCLAYELLAGVSPFGGRSPQQMMAAHVTETPEHVHKRRPSVPPALATLIMRCLEKRPGDRPQTANDLLAALDAITTPGAGMTPTSARPAGARPSRSLLLGGGLAAIVITVAVVAFIAMRPVAMPQAGESVRITNTPGLELDPAISPDGKFLAYAAGTLGQFRIYVRQISGGRTVALTDSMAGNHRRPRWTLDGSQLSFESRGVLYLVPALGGNPRALWDESRAEFPSPTLSADGKRVVYSDGKAAFVRAIEGGEPVRIAEARSPHSFAWSPDGDRIAFVSDNPWFEFGPTNVGNIAPSTIWVARADGTGAQVLTDSVHLNMSPAWMPDGRAIAFVSDAGGTRDIYFTAVTSNGAPQGTPTRLTTGLNAHSIGLSSDGSRLTYSVFTGRSNLWSVAMKRGATASGADARPLTNENQVIEVFSVSPDGKWLAFDSNRGGAQHIFKIPIDGGDPVQLTRDETDHFAPMWSPDSKQLLYHAWSGGSRDLFVMDADGRAVQRLLGSPANDFSRDWSLDGKSLLIMSDRDGSYQLYAMTRGADSGWSAPRRLTSDGAWTGKVAPDGSMIAYVPQTIPVVRVAPFSGGASRVLFDGRVSGETPLYAQWSPDSRFVYVHVKAGASGTRILAIPVAGGAPSVILAMEDPLRQPRRGEFVVANDRIYFTIAVDEADVSVMDLVKR